MKRTFSMLVCSLLMNTAAFAQTPYESLIAYRAQYPIPMATAAQIGELLNRVAWDHRAQGARLLGKKSGANCPTPSGILISCDYLVHGPSLTGHDVFQDAGPGGLTRPISFTWGPGKEDLAAAIASGARSLVEPTLPDSTTDPSPTPDPGTPPVSDEVAQRLTHIESTTNSLLAQAVILGAKLEAHIQSTEAFQQAVGREWKKFGIFLGKYVAPIVAGLLGGKFLLGGGGE